MLMNIMVKRKNHLMTKSKKNTPYHIKHNYKKFKSVSGYTFWAKNEEDAKEYCQLMKLVLGDFDVEDKQPERKQG